jgi:GR25 family glycosyltransferase involved in LPS biosynthesis
MNNYFDKIYCINLDRRTDRWERCLEIFDELSLNVERFSATDYKDIKHLKKTRDAIRYANLQSHKSLLKLAKSFRLNNILILEDDVEFVNDFKSKFNDKIKSLPDNWDMFYIGGLPKKKSKLIDKNIIKSKHIVSCHSYAINSKCFDFLIEKMTSLRTDGAVDNIYPKLQKYLNCYIMNPSLTYQRESFSDIDLKINNNKRSKLDEFTGD